MNDNLIELGGRMKDLRKLRGLTLARLAQATGLTAGLLSKIENARTIPSLPVLCAIAGALECAPGELLGADAGSVPDRPEQVRRRWFLVHSSDWRSIDRENSSGYDYRLIFESRLNTGRVQAMMVVIQPGATRRKVTGEGVESLYVLRGRCRYHLGADTVELIPGDTLFFDSTLAHVPENPGPEPVVMLVHYYLFEPVFAKE